LRRGIERHGKDSRSALFHLCALKQAVVETSGEDRFGRTLGRVTCAGVDANAEQVRQGCVQ
jgi:endonuclease YncB( thermonuclease family)